MEGSDVRDLQRAPGHIPGTSLLGEAGNTGIAGHRDTFFRPLRYVREGDEITVTTLGGEFKYRVESMEIVKPTDVQALYPTNKEMLTLVTCYPFNFIGHAPKRFIVHAKRVRPAQQLALKTASPRLTVQ